MLYLCNPPQKSDRIKSWGRKPNLPFIKSEKLMFRLTVFH
jgi:hypothetical protein